jgi:hypothetical protein
LQRRAARNPANEIESPLIPGREERQNRHPIGRHPQVRPVRWEREGRRHDGADMEVVRAERDAAFAPRAVASNLVDEPCTERDRRVRISDVPGHPPRRSETQRVEEPVGNHRPAHAARLARATQPEIAGRIRGDVVDGAQPAPPLVDFPEADVGRSVTPIRELNGHEPRRLAVRQRTKQQAVLEREGAGGQPCASCEGKHGGCEENRRPQQGTNGEPDVGGDEHHDLIRYLFSCCFPNGKTAHSYW